MMTFLSYLFAFLLVLDCLILSLLVLVQLPKKEAGAGMAFGGGAADALFGAGSGNALTKLTKYTAIFFFALVLALSFLDTSGKATAGQKLKRAMEGAPAVESQPAKAPAPMAAPTTLSNSSAPALTIGSNAAPAVPTAPVTTSPATNNPPK